MKTSTTAAHQPAGVPTSSEVDVMLLLEGTFPYVSGGVSSWVNQIIRAFPDIRFGIVFLGSRPQDYGKMKYELPSNVVHFEQHYLQGLETSTQVISSEGNAQAFERVSQLHQTLRENRNNSDPRLLTEAMSALLAEDSGISEQDFLHSRAAWDYITDKYRQHCTDPSFTDYFWTVRIMHQPIWMLARVARSLPRAKAYHTVSTGYAGFLGAVLKQLTGRPLILSEHGLYTKERKIDLFQMDWIRDNRDVFQKNATEIGYFRELWIRFFSSLGRMCYACADNITGLYEDIRVQQIAAGAPAERTRVIPNGIDLKRFMPAREKRCAEPPPVLTLIGRVVQIKDIKTFIRAMRTVVNRIPDAKGWIAGPEDEDKDYANDCHELVKSLGLENNVEFLGFRKVEEVLVDTGLLILSSISEALPLVLLEGYAAGVPAVTTNVGSCKQLIEGMAGEDAALGPSGVVVGIADPEALANAAIELLTDRERYQAAVTAAINRVETYYTQQIMFAAFREIYDGVLKRPSVELPLSCPFAISAQSSLAEKASWPA
ncbi:MAG: GT4 family glycosyltransferase PelF [Gammaproteobacteria bacterium]